MKILILCTGNSCRSQMAEGFLKSLDHNIQVHSAGTNPSGSVHPLAIKVMLEIGIDLSKNKTKNIDAYLGNEWDYVITVCDNAKESCPIFIGKVINRLHIGFKDPVEALGSEEEVLNVFRKIRDEIKNEFYQFFLNNIKTIMR